MQGSDRVKAVVPIFASFVAFVLISGCLDGGGGERSKGIEGVYEQRFMENPGTLDAYAQSVPDTTTEEIHYEVSDDQVVNITISVTVTDNNEGTDPDVVDLVRMWRENEPGEDDPVEIQGGTTPFTCSYHFELTGAESLTTWWIVELTVTCNSGSDTWPGPLIWRGVPDTGVAYDITYNFTVYLPPTSIP